MSLMKIQPLLEEILSKTEKHKSINKLCSEIQKSSYFKKLDLVLNNSTNKEKHIQCIREYTDKFLSTRDDFSLATMVFVLSKYEKINIKLDPRVLPLSFEMVVSVKLQQM